MAAYQSGLPVDGGRRGPDHRGDAQPRGRRDVLRQRIDGETLAGDELPAPRLQPGRHGLLPVAADEETDVIAPVDARVPVDGEQLRGAGKGRARLLEDLAGQRLGETLPRLDAASRKIPARQGIVLDQDNDAAI